MSYGRTFALWRAAAPDWDAYTRHGFVQALGDGSLPRAAFLTYLVQDYLFLIQFSRAWALAVVKAGDLQEMRACSATVHALLDQEMALHVQTCAAAGIDTAAMLATPEAVGNMAYTRYVLEAGYSGDFLDLLAALLPCVLGYGEIGARLGREGAPDTPLSRLDRHLRGRRLPANLPRRGRPAGRRCPQTAGRRAAIQPPLGGAGPPLRHGHPA